VDLTKYSNNLKNIKLKTNTIAVHPLKQNLFFIGSSNGLIVLKMDNNRFPSIGVGLYDSKKFNQLSVTSENLDFMNFDIEGINESEDETPSITVSKVSNIKDGEKALYYIEDKILYKRLIEK
jgi:hypothetical protein